jgi:4'-phosphopantetheinyl transferase
VTRVETGGLMEALKKGEHHVWLLRTDLRSDVSLLSDSERARALSFRFAEDGTRYAAAHVALRRLLAGYTGADPAALTITAPPQEKPALSGGAIEFNISHSGEWTALAFGCHAVGIDIERVQPLNAARELALDVLHPAEQRALAAHGGDAGEFFRIWTRKEALLKCTGKGLSVRLEEVDALDGSIGGVRIAVVTEIPAPRGYRAALAAAGEGRLRIFGDWRAEMNDP